MVLRTEDARARVDDGWEGQLYRSFDTPSAATTRVPLTAIPYYAWANRDAGPMQVWLPIATNEPASS